MKKSLVIFFMISLSFILFIQKMVDAKENMIRSKPEWYKMLSESFKPIEENKIKLLEQLRNKYRASNENLILSIMSTPLAVEKAQYDSLKHAKRMYSNLSEKDLWRLVLGSRFETWKITAGFEVHEYSKLSSEELLQRIEKLEMNIDSILANFNSFADVITFTICMEEEMGNFVDPSGILDELNSILGRGRPSEEDNKWYFSILNMLRDEALK